MNRIIQSMEEKYLNPSLEMVKELKSGALDHISGVVSYKDYQSLQ